MKPSTIYRPLSNLKWSIFDLFWLYPATFNNFSPKENSWNQLNNWQKILPVKYRLFSVTLYKHIVLLPSFCEDICTSLFLAISFPFNFLFCWCCFIIQIFSVTNFGTKQEVKLTVYNYSIYSISINKGIIIIIGRYWHKKNHLRSGLVSYGLVLWCFNATFNNISVISLQSVLLVEETGGTWENHWPSASKECMHSQSDLINELVVEF